MHVRIYVKGWKGIKQVPLDEAEILLVSRLEFEGKMIEYSGPAYLNLGAAGGDFMTLQIGGVHHADFARLTEVPERYTYGSTPSDTGIIVSGIEIVEEPGPVGARPAEEDLLRSALPS